MEIKDIDIQNAIITESRWGVEPALSHYLTLNGDGWGALFGGYVLTGEACYRWIIRIIDTLELKNFNESELIGKVIRVKRDMTDLRIIAIGHPIKELWFNPKEFCNSSYGRE